MKNVEELGTGAHRLELLREKQATSHGSGATPELAGAEAQRGMGVRILRDIETGEEVADHKHVTGRLNGPRFLVTIGPDGVVAVGELQA